ncbi:hypothetical protein, partial [Streptomyces sp. NPDC007205]|uniref:hypothetical protein n=1 Tax=Streptomyces sp. NPDC007205 TaxID=3154316 RepID=UPI0033E6B77F
EHHRNDQEPRLVTPHPLTCTFTPAGQDENGSLTKSSEPPVRQDVYYLPQMEGPEAVRLLGPQATHPLRQ